MPHKTVFSPTFATKRRISNIRKQPTNVPGGLTMGIIATKEDGESLEIRNLKEKVNVSLQMDASAVENSLSGYRLSSAMNSPILPKNGIISSRWTLPSIVLDSSGQGLANVSRETLDQCLQPIMEGLVGIDAEELLSLERVPQGSAGGAHLQSGIHVRPIHEEITPAATVECVRYVHITEVPGQYSMGIFIFPPNAKIPLHNHPGMCVLSRVLYGDLRRLSLDLERESNITTTHPASPNNANSTGDSPMEVDDNDDDDHDDDDTDHAWNEHESELEHSENSQINAVKPKSTGSSSWLPSWTMGRARRNYRSDTSSSTVSSAGVVHHHHNTPLSSQQEQLNSLPHGSKVAFKRETDSLHAPDTTALYPFEGNLHEFIAGPSGAAVLDILLPPYDVDHHRDCTFYEIHAIVQPPAAPSQSSPGVTVATRARAVSPSLGEPCFIVPTGQPEDFHCISGTYGDLNAC